MLPTMISMFQKLKLQHKECVCAKAMILLNTSTDAANWDTAQSVPFGGEWKSASGKGTSLS